MRISRGIPLLEYEVNYIAARIQSCYEELQQEDSMQKQYHEDINQILRNASQDFTCNPSFLADKVGSIEDPDLVWCFLNFDLGIPNEMLNFE